MINTPENLNPVFAEEAGKYIVYLLTNNVNSCTYIGCTNNPARRIRQHNGELVGGAKYTKRHGKDVGAVWQFRGHIPGLEKRQALSIEKRIQIRSRKMKAPRAIDRRLRAIAEILADYTVYGYTFIDSAPVCTTAVHSAPVCTTVPVRKLATITEPLDISVKSGETA